MKSSQNRKKQRKVNTLFEGKHFFIFCEGEQTEPLYFKGFEAAINSNPIYRNNVQVYVQGLGAETLRVIQYAENYVRENHIDNAEIWCVYDKDSFPSQDFNGVSERANYLNSLPSNVKYNVAWSNQCVEYWFILHFAYYDSNNDRKYYRDFLHRKFHEFGWDKYEKNNNELFAIMTKHGNPNLAIRFAEKRMHECDGLTDSDCAPATKVYLLVKELAEYLPDDYRKKYISEQ